MTICNWRNLPLLFVGSLFALVPIAGQSDETLGTAMCRRAVPGASCSIAWDFTATPHASYWVEQFVYESSVELHSVEGEWQSVAGPLAGHEGVTDEPVEGGFLYRVVGCNDKSGTIGCVGSTVFWAPVRPKNLDDIPDVVYTPGGYWVRDRKHSALEQVIDYNAALIDKLIFTVDMKSKPVMTELPFPDLHDLPAGISLEDVTLDCNVHVACPPNHGK